MGQVVVNCEEAMDAVMENGDMGGGSSSTPRWDPSNSLRVLLVEADDSTRQIIGALLRKCNYKVVSVSDGLKAWELLKTRQDTIDLVLTEVELPSISGYALLTLISEHEFCKNIPVILMSTHDSVNTVYKCMIKGAADFLVKPIRINELRNLWQHVWRRQSACPRQEECFKKPDLEAESTFSYKTVEKSRVFDLKVQDYSNWDNSNQNLCPKAIDLMGSFDDNRSRRNWYSNDESTNKFDCSQRLDLSLRRYQPGALEINTTHEKQINHSNASAFTQYVNDSNAKDTDNISDSNIMTQCTNLEKEAENHGLHRLFPIPFPAMPPRVCSPTPTSQSPRVSSNQSMSEQEQRLESSEDGSSYRTETQSNGSDAVVPGVSDSGSEPLYCDRSILRKAALTKFRLKRKERCFDKKVRYESRKKLAEQRPRVKGQFVRQAPCDPSTNRV